MSVIIKGLTFPPVGVRQCVVAVPGGHLLISDVRAQLTKDLRERHDLFFLPISWANFKGTNECPLTKEVE